MARTPERSPRLKELPSIPRAVSEALGALDIVRADQLAAMVRIPKLRTELGDSFGVTEAVARAVEEAVAKTRSLRVAEAPAGDGKRSLGALRPPAAQMAMARSLPLTGTGKAPPPKLPPSKNLIPGMQPIRNQGSRGTCVAFCVTAIHEYADRATAPNYSERDLYYLTKKRDGNPTLCGTWQQAASEALRIDGQCREATWPYNPSDDCNNHGTPPAAAAQDRAAHRLGLVALNPNDVLGIKAAIAASKPVGISVPVFDSWFRSPVVEQTGRITLPLSGETPDGGHCMCLVGYQDDTPKTQTPTPGGGYFILRNSWDTSWGSSCQYGPGYGTIPYSYIATFNWESYTLPASSKKKKQTKKTVKARTRGKKGGKRR